MKETTTSLEPREKKSCAGVRRVRGFGVVLTPPVAHKGIAFACKRNTLNAGITIFQMISTTLKMSLMRLLKGTISIQF